MLSKRLAFSLGLAVDEVAVRLHAGHAKVVGTAAQGQHQHVVGHGAWPDHGSVTRRWQFGQVHQAAVAAEPAQLAGLIGKALGARLGQQADFVLVHIARAGGNGVQHGLPQVGEAAVDQRDLGAAFAPQLLA